MIWLNFTQNFSKLIDQKITLIFTSTDNFQCTRILLLFFQKGKNEKKVETFNRNGRKGKFKRNPALRKNIQ